MIRRGKHAAPRQIGRKTRFLGRAIPLALVASLFMTTVALADPVTDTGISINSSATYTNALTATVSTQPTHCPPNGDMNAIELSLSDDNVVWTIVKADGDTWPTGNCVSGV